MQFWSLWYLWIIVFLCVLLPARKQARLNTVRRVRKKRKGKENTQMEEFAKQFIGKECIVYVAEYSSAGVNGVIKEVSSGAVLVEDANGGVQVVNLDYITRIREYPRNKNGKKKSVVLD